MSGTDLSGPSAPTPTSTTPTPSPGGNSGSTNDDDIQNLLNQNGTDNAKKAGKDKEEKDPQMQQLEELMKFVEEMNGKITGAISQAISPALGAAGNTLSQGFNSVKGMFSSGGSPSVDDDAENDVESDDTLGADAGDSDSIEMSAMNMDTMVDPTDDIESMPELNQFQQLVSGQGQSQDQSLDIEEDATEAAGMSI